MKEKNRETQIINVIDVQKNASLCNLKGTVAYKEYLTRKI